MSAPHWRWSLIAAWVCVTCATFIVLGSMAGRSWWLLLVAAVTPPLMLLTFWTEDRPLPIGTLRRR